MSPKELIETIHAAEQEEGFNKSCTVMFGYIFKAINTEQFESISNVFGYEPVLSLTKEHLIGLVTMTYEYRYKINGYNTFLEKVKDVVRPQVSESEFNLCFEGMTTVKEITPDHIWSEENINYIKEVIQDQAAKRTQEQKLHIEQLGENINQKIMNNMDTEKLDKVIDRIIYLMEDADKNAEACAKQNAVGTQQYFLGLSQAYWNVKQILEVNFIENQEQPNSTVEN